MTLWMRYLSKQLLQMFLFLLCCLFFMYVLVDLSINGVGFLFQGNARGADLLIYYLRHLSMHLELFFALSFLLACLKVLIDLGQHQELVALQMAGLSRKKMLTPFYLLAALLCLGSYANCEWFAPTAQDAIQEFQFGHSKKKQQKKEQIHSISLNNHTDLVYQTIQKEALYDVFWIQSKKDIWHMKRLELSNPPKGQFVDHLARNGENQFEKVESWDEKEFAELAWPTDCCLERFIPFENRPLSLLAWQAFSHSVDKPKASAHLHYKLARPLLPLLALFAVAPLCMRYSRQKPLFLIVAGLLFGFIALMTLMEGLLILGEAQVLPAFVAGWAPLALLLAISLRPFSKI